MLGSYCPIPTAPLQDPRLKADGVRLFCTFWRRSGSTDSKSVKVTWAPIRAIAAPARPMPAPSSRQRLPFTRTVDHSPLRAFCVGFGCVVGGGSVVMEVKGSQGGVE